MMTEKNSLTKRLCQPALTIVCITSWLLVVAVQSVQAQDKTSGQRFRLTADELKSFEGYYRFTKNLDDYIEMTAAGNGLLAKRLNEGREFFLTPKSSTEFVSEIEKISVKFNKDNTGKVTEVLVLGKDVWKKVAKYELRKIIGLSPQKLKVLEGKYTFAFQQGEREFLDIIAKEDHIVLIENWTGNQIKFSPLSELEFVNQERTFPLKFIKDDSGAVTKVLAFNRDLWTKVNQ